MNIDEEFETPEEERRHRQLQLERYFLWLQDLDEEYQKLLLRVGDLTEDWADTVEGATGEGQRQVNATNRLIEILHTWRAEIDGIRRLSELTAATPTPWGAYVAPTYDREFLWAARHTSTIAAEMDVAINEALQAIHVPNAEYAPIERTMEHCAAAIRGARMRISAARRHEVHTLIYDMDTEEIPPQPTQRPDLQGGMWQPQGPALREEALRRAEQQLIRELDDRLRDYRTILLHLHNIMDEMETTQELLARQRFFRAGCINMIRNTMGMFRDEADAADRLAQQLAQIQFPWGAYVNPQYSAQLEKVVHDLLQIATTMKENWSAAYRELETEMPQVGDMILMIEWTFQILREVRKPLAALRDVFAHPQHPQQAELVQGGAHTCSTTLPMDHQEVEGLLDVHLPLSLREHRLPVITPNGVQVHLWRHGDEVAWFLLLAGFHPYFYVLVMLEPQERTMMMDSSMESIPAGLARVQLRANFWETPQRIPPMFGGAGDDMDPAAFAKLLQQVTAIMAGVKKEKIKCLLRGVPGLRAKIARHIGDENKVRGIITENAKRYSMELKANGAAVSRSKSAGPSATTRKSSIKPKENKSDGEQPGDGDRRVAFRKEVNKESPPEVDIKLCDDWSVPVRTSFSGTESGVYLSESLTQIQSWASQVRNKKIGAAVISPYAYEVAGLEKPTVVIANMLECRGAEEKRVTVKAWLLNLGLQTVTSKAKATEMVFQNPVKKSIVTSVEVEMKEATEEWKQALKQKKHADICELMAKLTVCPEAVQDIWQVAEYGKDMYRFRMRVTDDKVADILRASGQHGIFVNTPMHTTHKLGLVWLREPGQVVDLAYAMSKLMLVPNHYGIIKKEAGAYAIRCDYSALQETRKALQMDTANTWKVDGLPIEFGQKEVADLLTQFGWAVQVMPKSRYCRKGRASWSVKAEADPSRFVFPVLVGEVSYTIGMHSNRAVPVMEKPVEQKEVKGAFTWSDLFKGKTITEKRDKENTQTSFHARGKKRTSTTEENEEGLPTIPPGATPQTPGRGSSPGKRHRPYPAEFDISMHDREGDIDDEWCEDQAVREEQRLLRQRQDAIEAKLEQIMGAIQKLAVHQSPTAEPSRQAVNGGDAGEDTNL